MLINVSQINPDQLALAIQLASSGASFSGNFTSYVAASGWIGNTPVFATGGNQRISGVKSFTDTPLVPYVGPTGGVPSTRYVNDQDLAISGVLTGQLSASNGASLSAASGVLAATTLVVSGQASTGLNSLSGFVINTSGALQVLINSVVGSTPNAVTTTGNYVLAGGYVFSGSPLVPDPTTPSGAVNYETLYTVSGVLASSAGGRSPNSVTTTGNEIIGGFKEFTGSPFVPRPTLPSGAANFSFVSGVSGVLSSQIANIVPIVNIFTGLAVSTSFFLDQYNTVTGLNLIETFISHNFIVTGYALGVINSGTAVSQALSGSLYQRTLGGTKIAFTSFSINAGVFSYVSGGLTLPVSGLNRMGVDILNVPTGFTGLSIGVFGTGAS